MLVKRTIPGMAQFKVGRAAAGSGAVRANAVRWKIRTGFIRRRTGCWCPDNLSSDCRISGVKRLIRLRTVLFCDCRMATRSTSYRLTGEYCFVTAGWRREASYRPRAVLL
ncbi:hypothetical protein KCP71_25045 [Salmonella enterica subsp. enterica]|nr:hypothetical protein KCP71_25045 [Salmonella enterica subsp. enterica]